MKISLHQLKVFYTVTQVGSVTGAAHQLHMTQPAVSNIIRQLEDYYQCPLTETISRQLVITTFGQTVAQSYQQLAAILAATENQIQLLKGGLSGTLAIAVVSTARYFIPRLLGHFKSKYPDVHVKLTVCNRHEIRSRLLNNLDEFVIMSHPPTSLPVDCAEFYDDELVIAANIDHPLSKQTKPIQLNQLKQEAWIIREEGSGTRYAAENCLRKYKFSPKIAMEISDNEAIKQAIMSNMGISILSKQSIKIELNYGLITELKVKPFPMKHTWYLVKNQGKTLSPIAEHFFTFVHKHQPHFRIVY